MTDWAQLANTAARTGYSAESLPGFTSHVGWTHGFEPSRVHPQAQPIVVGGRVFLGTAGGGGQGPRAYGFAEATGGTPSGWSTTFETPPGSIQHAGASDGTVVVYGCSQGWVWAQACSTGTQAWAVQPGAGRADGSTRLAFRGAPCYVGSTFVIAGEDGYVYALNPDGSAAWPEPYAGGQPFISSPASDGTNVYIMDFAARLHAIRLSDGAAAPGWGTNPVQTVGLRSTLYHPVVANGVVLAAPAPAYWPAVLTPNVAPWGLGGFGGANGTWLGTNEGGGTNGTLLNAGSVDTIPSWRSTQNTYLAAYDGNPTIAHPTYQPYAAATGVAQPPFIHGHLALTDVSPPIVVDPGTGYYWCPQWVFLAAWGVVDPATRRAVDALYGTGTGDGNEDEPFAATLCANAFLTYSATGSFTAHGQGQWNRGTRTWTDLPDQYVNKQRWANVCSGGASAPVLSGGRVFHLSQHELLVRTWT